MTKENRKELRRESREITKAQPRFEKANLTDEQYEELDDKFYYDRRLQPEDMAYEWKRWSILGKEDRTYIAKLLRRGWKFVPASRHPETAGDGATEEMILIEGQVLMEQPLVINERAKEKIFNESIEGRKQHFERLRLENPERVFKSNKSYEAQSIPE